MTGLSGTVADAAWCAPLEGVRIEVLSAEGRVLHRSESDPKGRWNAAVEGGATLRFSKPGYVAKSGGVADASALTRLLSDELAAYQDRLVYEPGERVSAFVHSSLPYRARVARHGRRKSVVLELPSCEPSRQSVPDGTFVDTGPCWRESFSYTLPLEAQSGLYSLTVSDGARQVAVPFVITARSVDRGERAPLAVIANISTWQAYNLWGGRSRYRNFEADYDRRLASNSSIARSRLKSAVLGALPRGLVEGLRRRAHRSISGPAWRHEWLHVSRPMPICGLEDDDVMQPFVNHLAAAEWRLLAWLEAEGFRYDVLADTDLGLSPGCLAGRRAVLLSGHSEYWTRSAYERLREFHCAHGGWLINLAGNVAHGEVEADEVGSMRYVGMAYAEAEEPGANLFCVQTSVVDYGTCSPYRVVRPEHWIFADLPASRRDIFGQRCLLRERGPAPDLYHPARPNMEGGLRGQGASGWETDKLVVGCRAHIELLAQGMNRLGGADMVYAAPEGTAGGMFSASSISFGSSLLVDDGAASVSRAVIQHALR